MPPYPIYELDRLKREEIKAKISKRALMLEKIVGNDVPNLPCLLAF